MLDACLVITFGGAGRLDLIAGGERRVVIAARAGEEVVRPPARPRLEEALDAGAIEVESIDLDVADEQDALARYDADPAFRDRGDAEVLALAATRGYTVGSDDRAIGRRVRTDLGPDRIAGTLDVIVWAVRDERISLSDAHAFLENCDVGPALLRRLTVAGVDLEDLI